MAATPGRVRPATPADVPEILLLVRELAEYERALDQVETSEAQLTGLLFGGTEQAPGSTATTPSGAPAAYCHVVEVDADPEGRRLAGVALWFLSLSTWTGTHGIYLEDLMVRPEHRGHGYGRALLAELAHECVARGYRRLEWSVLDWNEHALGFYRRIGAEPMDDWLRRRLSGDALERLATALDPG